MNENKKIKKLLRNRQNVVTCDLEEYDCWGGDRLIGSYKTFGLLQQADSQWRVRMREEYGSTWEVIMDLPRVYYAVRINGPDGVELYARRFWRLEEVREFLIGGFDGIVK